MEADGGNEGVVEKVVRKERCVTAVGGGIWLADAKLPVDSRNEKDCS
jgi:fructose-1,6-bisphosphatase/inositol monophosphatase family enzyme